MGLGKAFGKIKDNVKGKSIIDHGVDQIAQTINENTNGKYASEVYKAQNFTKDTIHKVQDRMKNKDHECQDHQDHSDCQDQCHEDSENKGA